VDQASNVFVAGDSWAGFGNYYDITTIRYRASLLPFPWDPEERGSAASGSLLAEQL
jgi:hypothetical protein